MMGDAGRVMHDARMHLLNAVSLGVKIKPKTEEKLKYCLLVKICFGFTPRTEVPLQEAGLAPLLGYWHGEKNQTVTSASPGVASAQSHRTSTFRAAS